MHTFQCAVAYLLFYIKGLLNKLRCVQSSQTLDFHMIWYLTLSLLPHSCTTQKCNAADQNQNNVAILKLSTLARTQRLKGTEKM